MKKCAFIPILLALNFLLSACNDTVVLQTETNKTNTDISVGTSFETPGETTIPTFTATTEVANEINSIVTMVPPKQTIPTTSSITAVASENTSPTTPSTTEIEITETEYPTTLKPNKSASHLSDFSYRENADGDITISSYKGSAAHVTIPAQIEGKDVTEIGLLCFGWRHDTNTISVTLPNTIKVIDNLAFENCTSLETINLPNSLTKIGTRAFANCTSLKHITILSNCLNEYSAEAFYNSGLETIELKEGIEMIPETSFASTNIKEVVLPSSTTEICFQAFGGCESLETVVLNDGLKTIGNSVFAGTKITQLILPTSVTDVTELTFNGCSSLEKVVFKGDAPTEFINQGLSAYNSYYTIYYHSEAKGFTYPKWNGYSTEIIDSEEKARPIFSNFEYLENTNGGITILEYIGNDSEVIIPMHISGKSVTEIGMYAFKGNQTITSITIPDTVTTIGFRAFIFCSSLEIITLPQKLTLIETQAFESCRSLSSVTLPSTLIELGDNVFSNCVALKHICIPPSVTAWGHGIFAYSGLETVTLENGMEVVGDSAFQYAYALTEIIIPKSVKNISETTFIGCNSLTAVKFDGDAPINYNSEEEKKHNYTVYYHSDSNGFSSPTWSEYKTEIW